MAWPVRLTRIGMLAEQVVRCFWPVWTILFLALTPVILGWHARVPLEVLWGAGVLAVLALVVALGWGIWRFRWPRRAEAVARVDARMPGQPIAAVADSQAIGAGDPASQAVWRAHLERMAARTRDARAVEPDLRVSDRDPYGLRFVALLFFVTAFVFGSLLRVGDVTEVAAGGEASFVTGPVWEGWIEPPDYTGKPSLYLADIPAGDLDVSMGSRVTLRLYGEVGDLTVDETVSGRVDGLGAASDGQQAFDVMQDGRLAINGADGASWQINVLPDAAPTVEITGEVEVDALGEMSLPFAATDDYAVVQGEALVVLDIADVERRHGLLAEPDPREPLIVDLPMPFSGDRAEFEEFLVDDFSEHPFANMPVTVTLSVMDAMEQEGTSEPLEMILPGRRFFQPVARAVIEQRRDLMWSTANAPRVLGLMRAISHRPEDIFTGETVYLRFREIQRNLEAALDSDEGVTPEVRDELAAAMWELALQLEDGSLADARERLARAQERLEEAMRNGATDEEIAELMQELREATEAYMQLLADETDFAEQNGTDQPDQGENGETISNSQIQEMMDEIQRLMEEGQMAEAMELMEELNELLENLQITQGDGSGDPGGPRTPGQQSMEDLQDSLREQQELSDEAFRELQEQFNNGGQDPGQQDGQQGQQGQQDGQQPGQQGQQQGQSGQGTSPGDQSTGSGSQDDLGMGGEGTGTERFPEGAEGTLAERQEALRRELDRLRDNLPALSGEEAEIARRAIEDAERAMREAEEALRGNELAEALDRQAEAMDALREGMRALGRALAENDQESEPGQSRADGGSADGQRDPRQTDPLGRELGTTGEFGTDESMLQGGDVYRRAEELLEELRRRAAEQERPEEERDYLRRLLDRF